MKMQSYWVVSTLFDAVGWLVGVTLLGISFGALAGRCDAPFPAQPHDRFGFSFVAGCISSSADLCTSLFVTITPGVSIAIILGACTVSPCLFEAVALGCSSPASFAHPEATDEDDVAANRARIPVAYSPSYDITAGGIEQCHPFDSQKYSKVFGRWLAVIGITESDVLCPSLPPLSQLRRVHSWWYRVQLYYSCFLMCMLEVPCLCLLPGWLLRWRVLLPMARAMQGSSLSVDLALRFGWAVNLGGGFHHASYTKGHGFCVLADISLAVMRATERFPRRVSRVLVVDLDAHQGDGHEWDLGKRPDVTILDAFHHGIFPGDVHAREWIDYTIPLRPGDPGDRFLAELSTVLPLAMRETQPDLVIYNAGTDLLAGDPLSGLSIEWDAVKRRDRIVFEACGAGCRGHNDIFQASGARHVPVVMLLSGGYQATNARLIAESLRECDEAFGLLEHADATRGLPASPQ